MRFDDRKKQSYRLVIFFFAISFILSLLTGIYYGRYHPDVISKYFLPLKITLKNLSSPKDIRDNFSFVLKNKFSNPPLIDISVKQDAKDSLNEDLNNFRGSVLLKHKIKNYNGEIFYLGDSYKINFRLKGRLSDHRDNNRISLNVNMKDKKQILSMNKFSIQYPSTRNNLYELIGNYFLRYNNHIYSNTKIVEFKVNNNKFGNYLLVERPSEYYLENNNRRIGPIIDIERSIFKNDFGFNKFKEFNQDYIFREMIDTVQKDTSDLAINKLIRCFEKPDEYLNQCFDMKYLGKYFAMLEIISSSEIDFFEYKYYFNPINEKFEIINQDLHSYIYDEDMFSLFSNNGGIFIKKTKLKNKIVNYLFKNEQFLKSYFFNLDRMSNVTYIEKFFSEHSNLFKSESNFLRKNYGNETINFYEISKERFFKRIEIIREYLSEKHTDNISMDYDSINKLLNIRNNRSSIVYLVDLLNTNSNLSIILNPNENIQVSTKNLDLDNIDNLTIKYKIISTNILFNFDKKKIVSNRFDYNQKKYSLNDFIADFREQIHIKDKNIIIFNPIIIRKKYVIDDYDIVLSDGANISFANRGKLVINSNIKTSSDREKKIIIQSIDGSGIIVFNNKVEFNNVIFQNFNLSNNSTYDQLNYTSPITFINSIANLYNIKFKNILAEDSVNFINSNLDIDELAIYGNKKSDCIDLDFCKGRLSNIIINDCFNDGIDFSFSEIDINGINVSAINDNAISIGENSNIKIKAVSIDKSFLGIAIKDGSSAKINDAYIKNSTYGIAVYRKKNYFLDPQLNISKLNFKNVEKNRQILADKDYQFFLNNEMLSLNKNIEIDFFNEEKK